MIRQCFLANTGVRFHADQLQKVGLDPASLYPVVKTRPPAIYATAEKLDALRAAEASYNVTSQSQPAPTTPTASITSMTALISPPMHKREDSTRTLVNGVDPADIKYSPSCLTEEEEDVLDAVCPLYDQLDLVKAWWILEVVPLVQRYQEEDNEWVDELVINRGRPRHIPRPTADAPLHIHRSVKMRMAAQGLVETISNDKTSYEPRAKLRDNPVWVD